MNESKHSSEEIGKHNHDHHHHSHEFDPDSKPPYVTFALLILMVLLGIALVIYFELI